MENDRFRFRVWDDIHREMSCLESDDVNPFNISDYPQNNIMQCTGMRDKYNNLIYEGDVVYKKGAKSWKGEKLLSEVVWCSDSACFMLSDENGLHNIPRNPQNIDIMGNKYQHTNLLGG